MSILLSSSSQPPCCNIRNCDVKQDSFHHCLWPGIGENDYIIECILQGGYRDGVESGQENSLQSGFNAGYDQAVSTCWKIGHLRGKLR